MNYIDGFVAAVPKANREAYLAHASEAAKMFKEFGALRVTECWGDDVPEGKVTSFPMAVKAEEGEAVVFSFIEWPSRDKRQEGMAKLFADERMKGMTMPFDGARLIYGGFQAILDE